MKILVLLLSFLITIDSSYGIRGGIEAAHGEFPYIVSIQLWYQRFLSSKFSYNHHCGGTIYNNLTILTSASCFVDVGNQSQYTISDLRIVAGATGSSNLDTLNGTEQIRNVSSLIIHPVGNVDVWDHNIALVKLSSALEFNNYVAPIQLPKQGSRPYDGQMCTLSGWGHINDTWYHGPAFFSPILRKVDVPVIPDKRCERFYTAKSGMVCIDFSWGNTGFKSGDKGGPLVVKGTKVQVGIITKGEDFDYGAFTQVSYYTDWIIADGSPEIVPSSLTILITLIYLLN